jgi:parallel beta-helix repeat protein
MKKQLLTFLMISCVFFTQAQTKKYVSLTGTDAPASGSISNPYRTITYAANTLAAGDTLFVRGGLYTNATYGDNYYWNQDRTARVSGIDGTATQYIVIMPYPNEAVTLRGDGDFIFNITGCSYVKFQGFEIYGEMENISLPLAFQYQFAFRRTTNVGANNVHENRVPVGTNTDQSGLEDLTPFTIFRPYYFFTHGIVVQNSHHIDIVGNTVHHMPGEGIRFAGSDYINCNKNIVHNNSRRSSTGVHGISCYTLRSIDANNGTKVIFDGNTVYDNYNEVFSWSEGKTVISAIIDEGKGLTIQRCFAAGTGEWDNGRILFVNNIAYTNGLAGIHVNDGDRIDIINNTVYRNDRYGSGNNLGISVAGANDVKIYNNIVVADLSWGGFTLSATPSSTAVVVSNNLVDGIASASSGLDSDIDAIDVNTINGAPTFVNAAARNFRLQSGSLGINNALASVAPARDYFGVLRDATPDRGAIEFTTVVPLTLLNFNVTKQSNSALLSWATANEINAAYFYVQHSTDGITWKTIEKVLTTGNSSSTEKYTAIHTQPTAGKNYYRLQQADADGKSSLSLIRILDWLGENSIQVFPNPFTSYITISGNIKSSDIKMYSATGVNVTSGLKLSQIGQQTKIETNLLSNGVYTLVVNNNSYQIIKTK